MKTSVKKIKTVWLYVVVALNTIFLRKKVTHGFYFSEAQDSVSGLFEAERLTHPYFKGKRYTECKSVKSGWVNWPDARLIGVGTYADVEIK